MAIRARGITKSYGRLTVLSGVDLDVEPGSVVALLGPNGAGKTTLVRILATLLAPDDGSATVAGHDVVRAPERVRAAIGLTGQYAAVDELLTGEENLLMIARLCRLGRAAARQRSRDLLARFDLAAAGRRRVRTYSGGMRRRLDLAASLVGRPAVLFLDEPTTGLDPRSRHTTWEVVRELAAGGVAVLLTTQYLEEADQIADRVCLLDQGTLVAEGTPEQLKDALGGERVALHLHDPAEVPRAAALLGAPPEAVDALTRTVSVRTDGSAAGLRALLDTMAGHGIEPRRVTTHRPSLDDVFLTLTKGA